MMLRKTMKKIALLLAVITLNFMAFPAWAEGEVILDRLTKEQAEELNIVIPKKTPPGFHSLTIEVYDDNGVVKNKEIPFCKNLIGLRIEHGVIQSFSMNELSLIVFVLFFCN